MIERLIASHDRARQFVTDLGILAATVTTIVRFHPRRPNPTAYPFLCRNCAARLRRVPGRWRGDVQLFADRNGHYACDGTIRTRHSPTARI